MQSSSRKKSLLNKKIDVLELLAYVMIARFSCTALANVPLFSMSFVFIYGMMFIFMFLTGYKSLRIQELNCLIALLVYTAYVLMVTLNMGLFNSYAFNSYILIFLYFIFMYIRRSDKMVGYRIGIIAIAGYTFTAVYSIPLLINDPDIVRKTAASLVQEGSTGFLNFVGGFDTVYGIVILLVGMYYLLGERISKKFRYLLWVGIVGSLLFAIMASYGTAIILLVCALAMIVYNRSQMGSLFILITLTLCIIFREPIGGVLYSFADGITEFDTLSIKLKDMATMLILGESAGTLAGEGGRLSMMKDSIELFLKYPILGGFGKGRIGGHSELLDTLARYGLVGTIPLIYFWASFFKNIFSEVKTERGKKCIIISVVLYVAISVLDPAMYAQQILPFFVVFPLFGILSDLKEQK